MRRRYVRLPICEIPIRVNSGIGPVTKWKRTLIRERRGVFILHRAINWDAFNGPFTVTHLPTGASVAKGLELPKARAVLRAFAAIPGDWTFTEPNAMPKSLRRKGTAALRRVLA